MTLKMIAYDDAPTREWVPAGFTDTEVLRYYFGEFADDGLGPQGFLTQVTNRTIPSHCHGVDQFQILLGVPGSFYQRHEVPPLMLHYADAYSTYGPIGGIDPPLRFFTLRPHMNRSMHIMPADRAELPYLGRRQKHMEIEELTDEEMAATEDVVVSTLIDAEGDGLEALMITGGAGATIEISPTAATNGQYLYVANGSVEWNGKTYEKLSLGWQTPTDEPAELHAGPSGCRLLVLRYPSPETHLVHAEATKVGANA